MKIVIYAGWGGFGVPERVAEIVDPQRTLRERPPWKGLVSNEHFDIFSDNPEAYRAHPALVDAFENTGACSGNFKIVEVPEDAAWTVEEYDGWEWVAEWHRVWE